MRASPVQLTVTITAADRITASAAKRALDISLDDITQREIPRRCGGYATKFRIQRVNNVGKHQLNLPHLNQFAALTSELELNLFGAEFLRRDFRFGHCGRRDIRGRGSYLANVGDAARVMICKHR